MATETVGQIFKLIPKIMKEVGAIAKSRRNPQQGYAFRGIDDIYNAVQSHFSENGVFVSPEVVEQIREERKTQKGGTLIYTLLRVKHTFYAPDGSNFTAVTVGEAMDSGDKSANKAMSAAMKYALIEVFAIPTEGDNDTENVTHEPSVPVRRREIVNEDTGEVRDPEAMPIPNKMSVADAEKLASDINMAFETKGFPPALADKILRGTLRKQKFPNVKAAGHDFAVKLIGNILNGTYDNMNKGATATAGAA